jgi:hypothetical protein
VCDWYTLMRLVDEDLPCFEPFRRIGRSLGPRSRGFESPRPDIGGFPVPFR